MGGHLMSSSKENRILEELESLPLLIKRQSAPEVLAEKIMDSISIKETAFVAERFSFFVLKWALVVVVFWVIGISLFLKFNDEKKITVKFVLDRQGARDISLAGDFNGWDTNKNKLVRQGNTWVLEMKLNPGRYQYMFVLNGTDWVSDDKAKETIDDGFGRTNAIL